MSSHLKLPIESLKLTIDLNGIDLPEVPRLQTGILGQPRAQSALEFGIAMPNPGYNVFVMGETGLGRLTMIMNHLETLAHTRTAPSSYAYVDNFDNSREPVVIELPAEYGQVLNKDIEKFLDDLLENFPAAFESPTYQQKKSAIERQFSQNYNAAIDIVDKKAQTLSIALFKESETITFAPIRKDKSLNEEQFQQLPQAERDIFHKHVEELEDYLSEVLLELPQWRRAMIDKIKQLDSDTISLAIEPLFAELEEKYQNIDDVIT